MQSRILSGTAEANRIEADAVRLWEPARSEVLGKPRAAYVPGFLGARAYLSAGLPGANCWVTGPAAAMARDADVDLVEVERQYTERGVGTPLRENRIDGVPLADRLAGTVAALTHRGD